MGICHLAQCSALRSQTSITVPKQSESWRPFNTVHLVRPSGLSGPSVQSFESVCLARPVNSGLPSPFVRSVRAVRPLSTSYPSAWPIPAHPVCPICPSSPLRPGSPSGPSGPSGLSVRTCSDHPWSPVQTSAPHGSRRWAVHTSCTERQF